VGFTMAILKGLPKEIPLLEIGNAAKAAAFKAFEKGNIEIFRAMHDEGWIRFAPKENFVTYFTHPDLKETISLDDLLVHCYNPSVKILKFLAETHKFEPLDLPGGRDLLFEIGSGEYLKWISSSTDPFLGVNREVIHNYLVLIADDSNNDKEDLLAYVSEIAKYYGSQIDKSLTQRLIDVAQDALVPKGLFEKYIKFLKDLDLSLPKWTFQSYHNSLKETVRILRNEGSAIPESELTNALWGFLNFEGVKIEAESFFEEALYSGYRIQLMKAYLAKYPSTPRGNCLHSLHNLSLEEIFEFLAAIEEIHWEYGSRDKDTWKEIIRAFRRKITPQQITKLYRWFKNHSQIEPEDMNKYLFLYVAVATLEPLFSPQDIFAEGTEDRKCLSLAMITKHYFETKFGKNLRDDNILLLDLPQKMDLLFLNKVPLHIP
jgi:hypothetical protein